MQHPEEYDVIVVGGGHAGVEAALASARMGARTILITHNIETIGQLSCNPAIGGIGKGHLVKEIDAMGGLMARAADMSGIQFRILNARKGPAVRATRAQTDRVRYKGVVRSAVESQKSLDLFQQSVDDLILEQDCVIGVVTQMGVKILSKAVILTTGTFLSGIIHVGLTNYEGGRAGDPPSNRLSHRLRDLLFHVERLKTGTPPRIDGRSIDFSQCVEQPGDEPVPVFSFFGRVEDHPQQVSCYITHTNIRTHDIIRGGLSRSPLYTGVIDGVGPRYCPSIEDKVVRFEDKSSHQVFLEPEGLDTHEIYPNGISTSLPFDVQLDIVRSLRGCENAHVTRPGYAIEYDFYDPRGLRPSLESHQIKCLFLAGQINGTTGYEEAGAQGLLAGINSVQRIRGESPWCPGRGEAYLGVLVDDLITRGTNEPYRMFTSRAEYRLLLREDNADLRLTEKARMLGLIGDRQWYAFEEKQNAIERERSRLRDIRIRPGDISNGIQAEALNITLSRDVNALELLKRPSLNYHALMQLPGVGPGVSDTKVAEQLEIQAHYAGYIDRQLDEIERLGRQESTELPDDFNYADVRGLSSEVREKLLRYRPSTIGQASRISGVTPAAISLLLIHLRRMGKG